MMILTVSDYKYVPGQGAQICNGPVIVATVHGTSYPIGSACQSDVDLARVMAAGPEMLAALEMVHRVLTCENVHSPLVESELNEIAAIIARAKAVQS